MAGLLPLASWSCVATLVLLPLVVPALPIVDPGLFVIMGVSTCGNGSGYCLLGLDCTLDDDFVPDKRGGHCRGLLTAFTPSANFVCCRYSMAEGAVTDPDPDREDATAEPATEQPATAAAERGNASAAVSLTTGDETSTNSKIEENLITVTSKVSIPDINFFRISENRQDQYAENPNTFVAQGNNPINEFVDYFNSFLQKNTYVYDPAAEESADVTTTEEWRAVDGQQADTVDNSTVFTEHVPMRPSVHPCWMVLFQDIRSGHIICAGALIANNIALSTATCATRLLATGTQYIGLFGTNKQIKSVSVHEDFSTSRNQQLMNSIGLLKFTNDNLPVHDCSLSITDAKTDINKKLCGTILSTYDYGSIHTEMCSSSVQKETDSTLSIRCDRVSNRQEQVIPGSPLVCEGILSGFAVHTKGEMVHFVAVSPYILWILQNT